MLLALSGGLWVSSQAQSAKHWEKVADQSLTQGDFFGAAHYYKLATESDTGNLNLVYRYAEALRLNQNYKEAESEYATVWQKDGGKQFPETQFWLAKMQKQNGKYKEAGSNFKSFKRNFRDRQNIIYAATKQEMKSCAFADRMANAKGEWEVSNLGQDLNSFDSEFAPFLLNDSTLIFSALRYGKINADNSLPLDSLYFVRLYQAQRKGEQWETIGPWDSTLNLDGLHVANLTSGEDRKRVYFSVCDDKQQCEIYTATWLDDQWGQATPMDDPINVPGFTSTQPSVALIDGKETLFFVSNRPKGKGQLDIWFSQKDHNGKFRKVKNAGSKVNTKGNEITPFYRVDEGALYFSSDWHLGLGGFDVLTSKGTRSFKASSNLGPPINTAAHDYYYSYFPAANQGFLSSNRSGGLSKSGTCCNDLYQIRLPEILPSDTLTPEEDLQLTFAELNSYLPLTLYFHNDEPNPRSRDTTTTLNYQTTLDSYLKMRKTYESEYASGLKKNEAKLAREDMTALFEEDIAQGGKDLDLFAGLLLVELKKGRRIELALKGYASPLAKSDYNLILTQRRIASLVNYLRAFEKGALVPYLDQTAENGGALELYRIPFGENKSDLAVSDNLNDKQNSVYSRKAALERKIEILEVKELTEDDSPDALMFEDQVLDLGTIKQGEKVAFTYKFTNISNKPITIQKVNPGCGCTVTDHPKDEIQPGESGEIEVTFNSEGKMGPQTQSVTVMWQAPAQFKKLQFRIEVMP